MQLRDYQTKSIEEIYDAFRCSRRAVCLQAPTGSGKTVVASQLIGDAVKEHERVWFACHRQELVDQTSLTLGKCGVTHGYIAAGYPDDDAQVMIASVDTLVRRLDKIEDMPGLLVIDEAHHSVARTWKRVIERAIAEGTRVVGVTATPQRLDGRGLGKIYDHLVVSLQTDELIARGALSDYEYFAADVGVDFSKLRKRAGDYDLKQLAAEFDDVDLIGDIVTEWERRAEGKLTLGFAINVAHSKHIVNEFVSRGHPAAHLDGGTPKAKRRETLQALARGEIKVVFNCALFGEGYDLSANAGIDATVECVIMARPTQSTTIYLQQAGRALRPKQDGSKAVILDHANNWLRHDLPCARREWSLQGTKKDKDAPALKRCPECFTVMRSIEPVCPKCGYVFPAELRPKRDLVHEAGELAQIDVEAARAARNAELDWYREVTDIVWNEGGFEALVDLAKARGLSRPHVWAREETERRTA